MIMIDYLSQLAVPMIQDSEERKTSSGCKIIRITEKDDATKESAITELATNTRAFHDQGVEK